MGIKETLQKFGQWGFKKLNDVWKLTKDFASDFSNGITQDMSEPTYPSILRHALVKTYFNNFDDKVLVGRLNGFILGKTDVAPVRGNRHHRDRSLAAPPPNFKNILGWRVINPLNLLYLISHTLKQSGLKLCDNLANMAAPKAKTGILNRIGNGLVKGSAIVMKVIISLAFVVPDLAGYILAKPSNAIVEWISPFKDKLKNSRQTHPIDISNAEDKHALRGQSSSAQAFSRLRVDTRIREFKDESFMINITPAAEGSSSSSPSAEGAPAMPTISPNSSPSSPAISAERTPSPHR